MRGAGPPHGLPPTPIRGRSEAHAGPPIRSSPSSASSIVARAARRTRNRWLRVVDDTADLPDVAVHDAGTDLDLERAIARLAERQQLAVHLHYFVGLSVDETAAVMACSVGTVKSTLFDARTKLRTLLGGDDD